MNFPRSRRYQRTGPWMRGGEKTSAAGSIETLSGVPKGEPLAARAGMPTSLGALVNVATDPRALAPHALLFSRAVASSRDTQAWVKAASASAAAQSLLAGAPFSRASTGRRRRLSGPFRVRWRGTGVRHVDRRVLAEPRAFGGGPDHPDQSHRWSLALDPSAGPGGISPSAPAASTTPRTSREPPTFGSPSAARSTRRRGTCSSTRCTSAPPRPARWSIQGEAPLTQRTQGDHGT